MDASGVPFMYRSAISAVFSPMPTSSMAMVARHPEATVVAEEQ